MVSTLPPLTQSKPTAASKLSATFYNFRNDVNATNRNNSKSGDGGVRAARRIGFCFSLSLSLSLFLSLLVSTSPRLSTSFWSRTHLGCAHAWGCTHNWVADSGFDSEGLGASSVTPPLWRGAESLCAILKGNLEILQYI